MVVLLPAVASANSEAIRSTTLGLSSIETMKPNGEFKVEVLKDNQWQKAGSLSYDKYFRDREIDLGKFISGNRTVKIRLAEKGGGAAHIDSVFLAGASPVEAQLIAPSDAGDTLKHQDEILKKVSKKDYDVIDAFDKTLEFTFSLVNGPIHELPLRLTARVEPTIISQIPFQYPTQNMYRPMNEHSRFYRYELDSVKGSLKLDGKMEEVSVEKPFFKEFAKSGSGHPSGFTYGWVRNDAENLYVAMDFTADNTYDGDKDYAKVYVKTGTGLKEFKVSVPETEWGLSDFTYSDKVAYEHKTYKFKIPFKELGIKEAGKNKELQLAFASYGTASPGDYQAKLAYDFVNNRFLLVYMNVDASYNTNLYGQLLTRDGTEFGEAFQISNTPGVWNPFSVAYDSINQRFLVAWDNGDINGQIVNAGGTLFNSNFIISNATNSQFVPSVGYDSANQKFLVVWEDFRAGNSDPNIYGQLVNPDGGLAGGDFVICDNPGQQYWPSVAYDSANQRFLVAWFDLRNGNNDIYGQLVNANGTLFGTTSNVNFAISNNAGSQIDPSVAYDSANQRFLVAWVDSRNGNNDIYGQLVNANGTLYNTASDVNFAISNATNDQNYPSTAYDADNQRFLVVWEDYRSGSSWDIYGQLVNADGSLYDTASDVNFVISNAANVQYRPSVAHNSICGNFLTAYETNETGPFDIGLTIVGPPCALNGPDLTGGWTGFTSSRGGKSVLGSLNLQNVGNQNVRSFKVEFYLSDDGTTLGKLLRTRTVRRLNAGASHSIRFRYSSGTSISGKFIIAVIDSTGQVSEADENNNRAAASIP